MLRIVVLLAAIVVLGGCASSPVQPSQRNGAADDAAFLRSQLVQLDTLKRPAECSEADWQSLKDSLRATIEHRLESGARGVSHAPSSFATQAHMGYDIDTHTLSWDYRNTGDYNQDGEVNVSDLTPLGAHLGQSVPPFSATSDDSIQAVVDGDLNNLITIADLTPLGANLGVRITKYNLYVSEDPTDIPSGPSAPSTIASFASASVGSYEGSRGAARVHYSYQLQSAPPPNLYYWVRPVDESEGDEGTPSLHVFNQQAAYPSAALAASQITGQAPVTVNFDATGSFGPSGTQFLAYSFDLDGDGNFTPFGLDKQASLEYTAAAVYPATVRVRDTITGLSDTATVIIDLTSHTPKWYRYTVPPFIDMDHVQGLAAATHGNVPFFVASYTSTSFSQSILNWRVASTPTGSNWSKQLGLASGGPWDQLELVSAGGTEGLFVPSQGSGQAMYWTVSEPFPSKIEYVETATNVATPLGFYSSATTNGFPSLAFYNKNGKTLHFVAALDSAGTLWGPDQDVTAGGFNLGEWPNLAEINAAPAIAYYDAGNASLRYVDSSYSITYNWKPPVTIDLGECQAQNSLVRLQDGSPGIVYRNQTAQAIYFARALTSAGDVWLPQDKQLIATTAGQAPIVPHTILLENDPHTFWYDPNSGLLMHSGADSNGQNWTTPDVITTDCSYDIPISPIQVNGLAGIAYCNADDTEIHFAIRY